MCGTGVTSLICPTSRPVACRERIAVSRPEPGPLTKTSTFFMPCSCALRAQFSAAICAANGVGLREPLKPTWPAEAQLITLPCGSVIEMMVLLNVLLMCACPWATFLFYLRRTFLAPAVRVLGGMSDLQIEVVGDHQGGHYFFGFFLPATVFFGPLRVRALVCVRCPWTGRPRRCRMPW